MTKYSYISSKLKMIQELRILWDNEEIISFIKGKEYIREQENEICHCIPNKDMDRDVFIEVARCDWILDQYTKKKL
jgi:hypothetical protein